jgi:hypothetical protein
MKMSLKVFIIFILSISFLGCRKEEEKKIINTYRISKSLHPFIFDKGSYWIYKKTNSGILDYLEVETITRDSFAELPTSPEQGIQGYDEFYNIKYSSSLTGSYDEQLFGYIISRGLYHGGFVFLSSKKIGDKFRNAELIDVLDTMTIENRTYKRVVKMKIQEDQYLTGNYNLYYADSVGLLRKEKTVNETIIESWNLIEFKTDLFRVK